MITKANTKSMQRRDFLKIMGAGLVSAWALSASSLPVLTGFPSLGQTTFDSRQLRGTRDGQILQSLDQGKTWQPLISFGSHCAVYDLLTQNGLLYAQLAVGGHSFWLYSPDAKTWRTLN